MLKQAITTSEGKIQSNLSLRQAKSSQYCKTAALDGFNTFYRLLGGNTTKNPGKPLLRKNIGFHRLYRRPFQSGPLLRKLILIHFLGPGNMPPVYPDENFLSHATSILLT